MSAQIQARLRAVRTKLHLTQKDLAAQLGVPLPTLIKWENDQRTPRGLALESLEGKLRALLKSGPP